MRKLLFLGVLVGGFTLFGSVPRASAGHDECEYNSYRSYNYRPTGYYHGYRPYRRSYYNFSYNSPGYHISVGRGGRFHFGYGGHHGYRDHHHHRRHHHHRFHH